MKVKSWVGCIKNLALEWWKTQAYIRLVWLISFALLGIYIARCFILNTECVLGWMSIGKSSLGSKDSFEKFVVNISLLLTSLPVLLGLWWFRTYDTRQQIENNKRQLDETVELRKTSAYHSLLSNGLQLITSDNVAGRCVGLVQLSLARKEKPEYSSQIDMSTQGLTLYMKGQDGSEAEVIKLSGAMLQNLNLKGAIMKKAQLLEADLRGANLVGADLREANLMGADLRGAHLDGANLEDAHLEGAHLEDAILEGANLTKAKLMGAKLTRANLERATLMEAWLQEAPLQKTHLEGANLKGARLDDAFLMGAVLIDADLTKSDVPLLPSLAWFHHEMQEHLISTDSGGANLGARAILLEGVDLSRAKYDRDTKFPSDFDPEDKKWGLIKVV